MALGTFNEESNRIKSAQTRPSVDPSRISWTAGLLSRAQRGDHIVANDRLIRTSLYRPFQKQYLFSQPEILERAASIAFTFPNLYENFGILVTGPSSQYLTFAALMVDAVPNLHLVHTGQFFPRFSYEKHVADENQLGGLDDDADEYTRVDNVTDGILKEYRATYGAEVSKDDIFFYVYGLLHSPEYRERFAADLKKMLPRIPKVKDFWGYADAGRRLSELHLGYETVEPWGLEEVVDGVVSTRPTNNGTPPADATEPGGVLHVKKMKYGGKSPKWDKTRVIVNERLELRGIPEKAHEYMLGSRSALDWILERYQIRTDKASGIVNDPNDWGREHDDPRYIVDLVKRITRVSIETVDIVSALPPLDILTDAGPTTPTPKTPGVRFE